VCVGGGGGGGITLVNSLSRRIASHTSTGGDLIFKPSLHKVHGGKHYDLVTSTRQSQRV
jgi:hypothetical protein